MKIVRLYGYLNDNLGDDLMFYVLLKRYPNVKFLYCDFWKATTPFIKFKNFYTMDEFYNKYGTINHVFNIISLKKHKDIFINKLKKKLENQIIGSVNIGGSIYIESERNIDKRMNYEITKLQKSPLFIIGSNFGPYKSEEFFNRFYSFFEHCSHVTFRDQSSYDLFSKLSNVNLASDVVLSEFPIPDRNGKYEDYVLISMVDIINKCSHRYKDDYFSFISDIIHECLCCKKVPCLVSFCDKEGDIDIINEFMKFIPLRMRNKIRIMNYSSNIEEFIILFRSCFAVLATRFHAMILALKFNKPCYSISYSTKINNYLDTYKLTNYCDLDKLCNYSAKKIFENYLLKEHVDYRVNYRDPFYYFDMFLNN